MNSIQNLKKIKRASLKKKSSKINLTFRNIIYQVSSGLAYMHKNGFFHRDMKP
jgi:serine/threonine protein kinase